MYTLKNTTVFTDLLTLNLAFVQGEYLCLIITVFRSDTTL